MNQLIDITILKNNRNYRLLYFGQFISFIGTMITSVALPFQIYKITHSTMMVGLLSMSQLLPLLFTALFGGVLADRCNRRLMLLVCELLLTIACCVLVYSAIIKTHSIFPLFIIAVTMSAITGLHRPAFDSLIQQIITPVEYKPAAALKGFAISFCMIAGPALAGLIIAQWGMVVTYSIDLLTFFISVFFLTLLKNIPNFKMEAKESIAASLNKGVQFALKRQPLIGSYLIDIIAMFFAIPNALFPAMAEKYWDTSALGMLYAAPAVGALVISFFSGWTSRVTREGRAIALSAGLCGFAIAGFGLSHSLNIALIFLAIYGALDTISGIFRASLWNSTIPYSYRGRLAGIEMISYISGPKLGDFRAGFVATSIGIPVTIISGGLLCAVGVGVSCLFLPKFWKYKTP